MKHKRLLKLFVPLVIGTSLAIPITSSAIPPEKATYEPATGVLHLPAIEVSGSAGEIEVFQADLVWKVDNSKSWFELVARHNSTALAGNPENATYDLDSNTVKVPLVEVQGSNGTKFYTGEMQLTSADQSRFIVTQVKEIDGSLINSLPPDPGEAGKATLAGVDSDGNGVRDDIQRHIILTYPNPEDALLRAALFQYAAYQQQFLRDADSPERTLANAHQRDKYVDCVMYLNPEEGLTIVEGMEIESVNTEERHQTYAKADNYLGGQVFSLTPRAELASLCGSVPETESKLRSKMLRDGNRLLPEPICSSTYIAFVNGIKNTAPSARASLWELEATLQDRLPATVNPKYVFVYNPTGWIGTVSDSWEVLTQKWGIESKDVDAHVALYEDWLARGKRVIVVAHSQGNLHANQSYDRLLDEKVENLSTNFRIVSVATPDTRIADQTPPYYYVTLVDDGVVGNNSGFLNPGLPGWERNDWYCWKQGDCSDDPKSFPKYDYGEKKEQADKNRHNFVSSYLRGNNTREWIIEEVVASIAETQAQATCPLIYGVHDDGVNDSQLFKMDSETFQVAPLGQLHKKHNLEALDINSEGGLYAVSSNSGTPDDTVKPGYLYKVDTETGNLQTIGNGLGFEDIDSISFDSQDILWGWSKSQGAVEIDTSTGTATFQNTPNLQEVEDMSWNGNLFYLIKGTELLSYDGVNPPQPICSNLPGGKPEGLEFVSENQMLIGVHGQESIHMMKIGDYGCETVGEIPVPYNDIEAMAWPFEETGL